MQELETNGQQGDGHDVVNSQRSTSTKVSFFGVNFHLQTNLFTYALISVMRCTCSREQKQGVREGV